MPQPTRELWPIHGYLQPHKLKSSGCSWQGQEAGDGRVGAFSPIFSLQMRMLIQRGGGVMGPNPCPFYDPLILQNTNFQNTIKCD